MSETSSSSLKIGVLREGKVPPDQRVPLSPAQCREFLQKFPSASIAVQSSPIRRITDDEYRAAGIDVVDDISDCDVLLGVKEVPVDQLIPDKTYLFFSHTYKLQPYNAKLLAAVVDKRIRLIDYEMLKRPSGKRIIGFGRWAGLVGAYNGFRAYGLRSGRFELPRAIDCRDLVEMLAAAQSKIDLPAGFRIVVTGAGRVGLGAREVLDSLGLRAVHKQDFLHLDTSEPIFTHLNVEDYNARVDDGSFNMKDFVEDPTAYKSTFGPFVRRAHMYIAGHFWAEGSPLLFTRDEVAAPGWSVEVVADISCDIDGPVATTIRPSTIANPLYGYRRSTGEECAFDDPDGVTVMAVDNLPCELPRDASEGFGRELVEHVLPLLVEGDADGILAGASETDTTGALTPPYAYLAGYVEAGRKKLNETA